MRSTATHDCNAFTRIESIYTNKIQSIKAGKSYQINRSTVSVHCVFRTHSLDFLKHRIITQSCGWQHKVTVYLESAHIWNRESWQSPPYWRLVTEYDFSQFYCFGSVNVHDTCRIYIGCVVILRRNNVSLADLKAKEPDALRIKKQQK